MTEIISHKQTSSDSCDNKDTGDDDHHSHRRGDGNSSDCRDKEPWKHHHSDGGISDDDKSGSCDDKPSRRHWRHKEHRVGPKKYHHHHECDSYDDNVFYDDEARPKSHHHYHSHSREREHWVPRSHSHEHEHWVPRRHSHESDNSEVEVDEIIVSRKGHWVWEDDKEPQRVKEHYQPKVYFQPESEHRQPKIYYQPESDHHHSQCHHESEQSQPQIVFTQESGYSQPQTHCHRETEYRQPQSHCHESNNFDDQVVEEIVHTRRGHWTWDDDGEERRVKNEHCGSYQPQPQPQKHCYQESDTFDKEVIEEVIHTRRGHWVWEDDGEERRVKEIDGGCHKSSHKKHNSDNYEYVQHYSEVPHKRIVRHKKPHSYRTETCIEDEVVYDKGKDAIVTEFIVDAEEEEEEEEVVHPKVVRVSETIVGNNVEGAKSRSHSQNTISPHRHKRLYVTKQPEEPTKTVKTHDSKYYEEILIESDVEQEKIVERAPRIIRRVAHRPSNNYKTVRLPEEDKKEEEIIIIEREETPTSKFVEHLASYPAVAAATGLAGSFPVAKMFVSNGVPLLKYIQEKSTDNRRIEPVYKKVKPVAKRFDRFGDEVLTSIDRRFPQLKTAEPIQIVGLVKEPAKKARRRVSTYQKKSGNRLNKRVVKPLKTFSKSARSQYNRVYDTNGKALLRSRLDPLVLPFNNRLENLIVDYLPQGQALPNRSNLSNELSRSWRLARTATNRARPVVRQQFNTARTVPLVATNRVNEVYNNNAVRYNTNTAQFSANPARSLFQEARVILDTGVQLGQELMGFAGFRNRRANAQPLVRTYDTSSSSGITLPSIITNIPSTITNIPSSVSSSLSGSSSCCLCPCLGSSSSDDSTSTDNSDITVVEDVVSPVIDDVVDVSDEADDDTADEDDATADEATDDDDTADEDDDTADVEAFIININ